MWIVYANELAAFVDMNRFKTSESVMYDMIKRVHGSLLSSVVKSLNLQDKKIGQEKIKATVAGL